MKHIISNFSIIQAYGNFVNYTTKVSIYVEKSTVSQFSFNWNMVHMNFYLLWFVWYISPLFKNNCYGVMSLNHGDVKGCANTLHDSLAIPLTRSPHRLLAAHSAGANIPIDQLLNESAYLCGSSSEPLQELHTTCSQLRIHTWRHGSGCVS